MKTYFVHQKKFVLKLDNKTKTFNDVHKNGLGKEMRSYSSERKKASNDQILDIAGTKSLLLYWEFMKFTQKVVPCTMG